MAEHFAGRVFQFARELFGRADHAVPGVVRVATLSIERPYLQCRMAIRHGLVDAHGYALYHEDEAIDYFCRGDFSSRSIPEDWLTCPIYLVTHYCVDSSTTVYTTHTLPSHLDTISGLEAQSDCARRELASLEQLAYSPLLIDARQSASQAADRQRAEDLKTLGVTEAADAAAIRMAYRDGSLKYHPDRLESLDLPAHLMELASEKFRGINAAYQRLRVQP